MRIKDLDQKKTLAVVHPFGTNLLYYRNPKMVAWWAAVLPGFGHILLGQYLKGSLLFMWEILINIQSHLNIGLVSTLHGDMEHTRSVLEPLWILLYIPIYLFAIWDSYQTANIVNHYLMTESKFTIQYKALNSLELNLLAKKKPAMGMFWSLLFPGAGQFYIHRLLESLLLSIWFIVIGYYSHFNEGLLYILMGEWHRSNEVYNVAWFMFLPSLLCFSAYNAYADGVESNIIWQYAETEKIKHLYQNPGFSVMFPEKEA